jgi:hypothetical protein
MDLGLSHFTRDSRADSVRPANRTLKFITRLLDTRISSVVYFAGATGLSVSTGPFSARVGYRLTGPDYQTMGGYYTKGDASALDLTSSVRMLGGKASLSGTASLQTDNITGNRDYTNQNLNWSLGAGLNPLQWLGCDVQYASYSTDQQPGALVPSESTRVRFATNSLTFSPRSSFSTGPAGHGLSASYSYQWVADRNAFTRDQSESQSRLATAGYSVSLSSLGLTLGLSGSASETRTRSGSSTNAGFGLSASQSLLAGALNLSLAPALAWTAAAGNVSALTATTSATANWRFLTHHSIAASVGHTGNVARTEGGRSFSELRTSLGYRLSF